MQSNHQPLFVGDISGAALCSYFPEGCRDVLRNLIGRPDVTELILAHRSEGFPVEVLALSAGLDRPFLTLNGDGISLHLLRRRSKEKSPQRMAVERSWLKDLLKRLNPPFLHCIGGSVIVDLCLLDLTLPAVFTLTDKSSFLRGAVLRNQLKKKAVGKHSGIYLAANSASLQAQAEQAFGSWVPMIPHPIYAALRSSRKPIQRVTRNHNVLFASCIHQRPHFFGQIIKQIHDQLPAVRLRCAVPVESTDTVSRLPCSEWLDVIAYSEYPALVDDLSQATVVVCDVSSPQDLYLVLWSMYLGVPLVVSDQAEHVHGITDQGRLASVVSGGSVDRWTKAIINAINPPSQVLLEARDFVEELCDQTRVVEAYQKEYARILEFYESQN